MISRPAVMPDSVDVFSTCPQSEAAARNTYRQRVIETARWAEECGCTGILVYADNSLIDPWLISQVIAENTNRLSPLIAVQPVYMHPYSTAKMIASLAYLYRRRVYLNMIAGGFRNDLLALNDLTPHDERYDRLVEYTSIVMALTSASAPVSFSGRFYSTDKLRLTPALPGDLQPGLMVSGSSNPGAEAARALGAICIHYPGPASESGQVALDAGMKFGIRIGLVARATDREAWDTAVRRFPENRKGQLLHQYAMTVSDSSWHKSLSDFGSAVAQGRSPYWLGPFENYNTFCPYLVGGYDTVGMELSRYIKLGYSTFILDIPADRADIVHSTIAFREAGDLAGL